MFFLMGFSCDFHFMGFHGIVISLSCSCKNGKIFFHGISVAEIVGMVSIQCQIMSLMMSDDVQHISSNKLPSDHQTWLAGKWTIYCKSVILLA